MFSPPFSELEAILHRLITTIVESAEKMPRVRQLVGNSRALLVSAHVPPPPPPRWSTCCSQTCRAVRWCCPVWDWRSQWWARPGATPSCCSRPTSGGLRSAWIDISLQIWPLCFVAFLCVVYQHETALCLAGTCQRPMMATGISSTAAPATTSMPSSRRTKNWLLLGR